VAFLLPTVFCFAQFPSWSQPLEVIGLFAVVEIVLNGFLEPIIYGKTTGISPLGLLVAAMFWTWLWGTMGLLLSTPLTVCLAVLGKYVPSLSFFTIVLSERAELKPDVRFYQRLVALDDEGARDVVQTALKQHRKIEVFDEILIPALARAERDAGRNELDQTEQEFAWRIVGELLEDGGPDHGAAARTSQTAVANASGEAVSALRPVRVVGLPVQDVADTLILRMLGLSLSLRGSTLEIISDTESPMEVVERLAEHAPELVVVSQLPPEGLTWACYLVRRLRAHCAELPIVVGRWGERGGASAAARLMANGANHVVFSVAEASERIAPMASTAGQSQAMPLAVQVGGQLGGQLG
jgi:hypothetical protein